MTRCPKCGRETTVEPENEWRPFCSERCKMLDLGAWLSGEYGIPAIPDEDDLDALDESQEE